MRLKIDENLPPGLADLLRQFGHDAVSVLEQHMGGAPDPEIARICQEERRAILTLDTDFLDTKEYPPDQYWGIVVLRLRRQGILQILDTFDHLVSYLGDTSLGGKLCVVTESGVRVRA